MRRWRFAAVLGLGLGALSPGCHRSHANETPAVQPIPFKALKIVEPIYEGGLRGEWMDFGWVDHPSVPGKAAPMSFAGYGGWILANSHLKAEYGGVRFSFKTARPYGDFLEVRVDSTQATVFPRVKVKPLHTQPGKDGFTDVSVSIAELNPQGARFDRVVIRAVRDVPDEPILFDHVGLTERDPTLATRAGQAPMATGPAKPVKLAIDCGAPVHPINPLIYGIAYAPRKDAQDTQQFKIGASARRWGGNPASRYNWELGNAWNTGADYFYKNVNYTGVKDYTSERFLEDQMVRKMRTALTVPIMGWVAKDTRSAGFPADVFGSQQQEMDPDQGTAGNGLSKSGQKLESGPPSLTSVEASPEFIARWVRAIRQKDEKRGRSVDMYILDNEPALWNDTHRDVHPKPTTYDELLDRTLRYGAAIRKEDPGALIAGPAEWGWPAYFGSALDQVASNSDRRAHGDVPLIPWLLRKVREHETRNKTHLLDVLDVHFYPQAKGVGTNENGRTDAEGSALRLRSTRALWDPSYRDESWIGERIELIPRLKRWIAESAPGLGISIGEWNFGAERHMSGGLAVAEVLGRFGQQGITSAFYWTYPAADSPAAWAFRAYRNYDGKGAHFLDTSVSTRMVENVSLFASRDESTGRMVAILLNLNPQQALDAQVDLNGCPALSVKRVFTYDGDAKGFIESPAPKTQGLRLPKVTPYSITVVELGS